MTTWTNMKIQNMFECSCNAIKTTVTIRSMYGEYTDSVSNIQRKLKDNDLLPPVRKMFQEMVDYWEGVK